MSALSSAERALSPVPSTRQTESPRSCPNVNERDRATSQKPSQWVTEICNPDAQRTSEATQFVLGQPGETSFGPRELGSFDFSTLAQFIETEPASRPERTKSG